MTEIERKFKDTSYTHLSKIGKAISSPKRLEILDVLLQGAKTVDSIARETDMSVANTSQHLQTLLESRLVEYQKQGLYSIYKLSDKNVVDFIFALQSLGEKRIAEIQKTREEIYTSKENIEVLHINDLTEQLMNNITLVDVRPKEEYDILHIPGSNSIPLEELESKISSLDINKKIIAYCRGKYCLLSVEAVELLKTHGFRALRLEENAQEWYSLNK